MERCKLSELSISTVTEQNTTDEEKSAAASGSEITTWNRYKGTVIYFAGLLPYPPVNSLPSLKGCFRSAPN